MATIRAFSSPAFGMTRATALQLPEGVLDGQVQASESQQPTRLREVVVQQMQQRLQDYLQENPGQADKWQGCTIRLLPKGREATLEIAGYPEEGESLVSDWLKEWSRNEAKPALDAGKTKLDETKTIARSDSDSRDKDALIGRYSTLGVGLLSLIAGIGINITATVERKREEALKKKEGKGEDKGGPWRWLKTLGTICFIAASSVLTLGGFLRSRQRSLQEMFRDIADNKTDGELTLEQKEQPLQQAQRFVERTLWSVVPVLNLSGNALIMAGSAIGAGSAIAGDAAASGQDGQDVSAQEAADAKAAKQSAGLNRAIEAIGTGMGVAGNMFIAAPIKEAQEAGHLPDHPVVDFAVKHQMPLGAGTDQVGSMLLALAPLSKIFGPKGGDKETKVGIMDYAQLVMLPISLLCGLLTAWSPKNKEFGAQEIGQEAARYLRSSAPKDESGKALIHLSDIEQLTQRVMMQPEILNISQDEQQKIKMATAKALCEFGGDGVALGEDVLPLLAAAEQTQCMPQPLQAAG